MPPRSSFSMRLQADVSSGAAAEYARVSSRALYIEL